MPLHEFLKSSDTPNANSQSKAKKVLILGSGGLSIGQAGEFDYSGTQAVKSVMEEGLIPIIINPNIATVQTNPQDGAKVYLYPVEPKWVEKVIEKEKPSAIMASFGGQTALNCLIELDKLGILKKHGVRNLGTSVETLELSEDRDKFAQLMKKISMPIPPSFACHSYEEALKAVAEIEYPVIVRAAYALGGLGSGFATNDDELRDLVIPALASSPQVLVEKSLKGWKEVEYEVMRDGQGNTITICNMENFDPLGIHTGDSIVVCPSQSLSDEEYQMLRNVSIKIVNALNIVGECNVQLALNPNSLEFYVIEVNARLSRSSALASKASGYPIALVAAKVVMGYDLLEIVNPVTQNTTAFTEPALDYLTIKIPKWDLKKFKGVSRRLGSTMKSVGEIMAIGRSFPEAIQKAVRMVTESSNGLSEFSKLFEKENVLSALSDPTDMRFYAVMDAFRLGYTLEEIYQKTEIDLWFLSHLNSIFLVEERIKEVAGAAGFDFSKGFDFTSYCKNVMQPISRDELTHWKQMGFADAQIVHLCKLALPAQWQGKVNWQDEFNAEKSFRELRRFKNVNPVFKKIDTTAAEYPSPSNYLYSTYHGLFHDPIEKNISKKAAVILGCGPYRVGTSVEFDWCAVSCAQELQCAGWRSIIINCNPETVSTDYNCSDSLYFDELSLERILDIVEFENAEGVIVSMGGQLPNRLAKPLRECGVNVMGHSAESIELAEDRQKFSHLLDSLEIDQPQWISATGEGEISNFVEKVGFPVLIRPSFVLSGAAMNVAYDRESLNKYLKGAFAISNEYPVVISEFIEGAHEIEVDGVAKNGEIVTSVTSEHIENAGVHSGDATTVVPAQKIYVETVRKIRKASKKIAAGLKLNGPFNIQFLAKSNQIKVIECNARAARSFPFISKVTSCNLAGLATKVIIGGDPELRMIKEDNLDHVGVKAALFSFKRLSGADPVLGVEMASTGEVGCIGQDFGEALTLALAASHIQAPKKAVLVSAGPEKQKLKFIEVAKILKKLQIPIYATAGTAKFLSDHGFEAQTLAWPDEEGVTVLDALKNGTIDFVVNLPKSSQKTELTNGSRIRQTAVLFGVPLITDMEKTLAYFQALEQNPESEYAVSSLPNYL